MTLRPMDPARRSDIYSDFVRAGRALVNPMYGHKAADDFAEGMTRAVEAFLAELDERIGEPTDG